MTDSNGPEDLLLQVSEAKERLTETIEEIDQTVLNFNTYKERYQAEAKEEFIGTVLDDVDHNGVTFTNAKVKRVTESGVSVMHSAGTGTLPFESLPLALREKIGATDAHLPIEIDTTPFEVPEPASDQLAPGQKTVTKVDNFNGSSPEGEDALSAATISESVVIIEGKNSAGTGFYVEIDGKQYIYTNAHVICGESKITLKTHDDKPITFPGMIEVAMDHDLARFPLRGTPCPNPFLLPTPDKEIKAGDQIAAYGNSGGAGLIREVTGVVNGVGHEELEISADIVPGNSGGPIVKPGTMIAVGVATRAVSYDDIYTRTTSMGIRRFGLRIENLNDWKQTDIIRLSAEWEKVIKINEDTISLAALLVMTPTYSGMALDPHAQIGPVGAKQWLESHRKSGMARTIWNSTATLNKKLGFGQQRAAPLAMAEVKAAYKSYFGSITAKYGTDVKGVDPNQFSWWYRGWIEASGDLRREVATGVNQFMNEISTIINSQAPK